MEKHALYLLNTLKNKFYAISIVITNLLIDSHGKKYWIENRMPNASKYSCIGIYMGSLGGLSYIAHTSKLYGTAIYFPSNWSTNKPIWRKLDDILTLDSISELTRKIDLNSVFMSLMRLSETQDIWLRGRKLFEKGHACEYLIEADLQL